MTLNKIPTNGRLELYTVDNFISKEHCDHLIKIIKANHKPAEIINSKDNDVETNKHFVKRTDEKSIISNVRSNSACHQLMWDPIGLMLDAKICKLMQTSQQRGDNMQGLFYDTKQKYNCHMDFHSDQDIVKSVGQRTWTIMVYLNAPTKGGATRFCKFDDLVIQPDIGKLVAWNNLNANGQGNRNSQHAGMPIIEGQKFAVVKWLKDLVPTPASIYTHWPTLQQKEYPINLFDV